MGNTAAVEQNIQSLLGSKPAVAALLADFNNHQIRWAIYAGCETALLVANRVPTDIDIIVHDDDFEKTAGLLPTLRRYDNESEIVTTTEGQKINFVACGLVGQLESTEIDIMAGAAFSIDGHEFPVRLTDAAVNNRLRFRYQDTDIFLANPFDTILIKAFMRRGAEQNKFDKPDAEALAKIISIDSNYRRQRTAEVGKTPEVERFLQEVGL